jgi:hypothetical protein
MAFTYQPILKLTGITTAKLFLAYTKVYMQLV